LTAASLAGIDSAPGSGHDSCQTASIRKEKALALVNHEVADVDEWERAHFEEDEMRSTVKAAKEKYEDALRAKFFGF
jgi:hypothetical protein